MAKFFDVNGNAVEIGDVEDRPFWYRHGERKEFAFVDAHPSLGYTINPEKAFDVTAIDLISNGHLSDLKVQNTPFFTAKRYGIDPQYAVTFNLKDRSRYQQLYPDIGIVFWVMWEIVAAEFSGNRYEVQQMYGVWKTDFRALAALCDRSPKHEYIKRREDSSNARDSYVLSLENPIFSKIA